MEPSTTFPIIEMFEFETVLGRRKKEKGKVEADQKNGG